ncbi:MAG: M20/M25/M40 family metallo-hydrolase [Eubacteriaceae bacterium]|nr:M20/M25/M40 family metallo-hydrolase [Eubacteriaceae bacterium]
MAGIIILVLIAVLLAVVLARTAAFRPHGEEKKEYAPLEFDRERAVENLRELVRCKTVSYYDHSLEDDAEFDKLIGLFEKLYPNVWKNCELTHFDGRGLLFRWKGSSSGGECPVFMAHYDVVPVEEQFWDEDPFGAVIKDGRIWGRGTVDTKNSLNGILTAAENLMASGFTPKNDIYFAFSGGEEVEGLGARNIALWFKENGIVPSFVLDEGGAVVENVFPGVKGPCGLIGIAEKGMCNMTFTANSDGGHASAPGPHTPLGILSLACARMEAHPFRRRFTVPVLAMFDTLGRHSGFVYRMIFSNLWLFGGVLDRICKKSGGELNALVRTTVAFTQMQGSQAVNVIPPTASMTANLRLNPGDTVESALAYARQTVKDGSVIITAEGRDPSPISRTDCFGWEVVSDAVRAAWPGSIVAPYLMVQCFDSRHYSDVSDRVYKFSAADLTAEERHALHGNNEHIRLETVGRAVEFFMRIMKEC